MKRLPVNLSFEGIYRMLSAPIRSKLRSMIRAWFKSVRSRTTDLDIGQEIKKKTNKKRSGK